MVVESQQASRVSDTVLPVVVRLSDSVTIIHGDCLDVLPTLLPRLVYLTDQPYGTGWVRGGGGVGEFNAKHERPEWDVWDLEWIARLNAPKLIAAFCPVGKCEELCNALPSPMVMHYRKSNVRPNGVDREPIVVSPPRQVREFKKLAYNGDMPLHPCQKPENVMLWLVNELSDEGETISDPFMGSGTTGIACIRTGRKFIGIEKDPVHFATARLRLEKELRQGLLPLTHNAGGERTACPKGNDDHT
jgi:hypothetical protein